jgi:hypothetical protein
MTPAKMLGGFILLVSILIGTSAFAETLIANDRRIEFTIPKGFAKKRIQAAPSSIQYKLTFSVMNQEVREIGFGYWDNVPSLNEEAFTERLRRGRDPKTISSKNIKWSDAVFIKSPYDAKRSMIEIRQKCNWIGKDRYHVWLVIQSKPGVPINQGNIAVICWASDLGSMDATVKYFKKCVKENLKINS